MAWNLHSSCAMSIKSNVSSYMSPHPLSLTTDQLVGEARDVFVQHRFTIVPVVDANGRCVGVISASDVLNGNVDPKAAIGSIMSTSLVAVAADHRVTQAATTMANHTVHHAVVVDISMEPVGVFSTVDVSRAVADSDLDQPAEVIMTEELVSVDPADDPAEVHEMLADGGFSEAPVMRAGEIVGVVTQRALLRGMEDDATRVDEVMDRNVVTMNSRASVSEVAAVLGEREVRRVFLVDDAGDLVGMVSTSDLTGYVASLYESFGE